MSKQKRRKRSKSLNLSTLADETIDPEERIFNDYKRWGQNGPGSWAGIGKTKRTLESGFYDASIDGAGTPTLIRRPLKTDELIEPKNPLLSQVLEEIEEFWQKEEVFKQHGFLHRRGYLFYGPPGSGKTALVQLIMKDLIKRGGIIVNGARPAFLELMLPIIRQIEPDRQIICLFEDIDSIIAHQGDENLLATLDGESQVDKVLNLATTNYPEKLDKRIKNRPRRFDRVLRVGMPEQDIREQYFRIKLGIEKDELQNWVDKSDGFSFAAMSDLVISVKCFDMTLDQAAEKVKELLFTKTDSEGYEKDFRQEKKAGF